MLNELLDQIIEELKDDEDSEIKFSTNEVNEIPTLKANVTIPASPQVSQLYCRIESWQCATHGDWLSIREMEMLWHEEPIDSRLLGIKRNLISASENWEDDAAFLFRPERLSVFAASEDTFERIYLLWFASKLEPELWVYDSNGETRFKDLVSYFQAYLDDDLSAVGKDWKLV